MWVFNDYSHSVYLPKKITECEDYKMKAKTAVVAIVLLASLVAFTYPLHMAVLNILEALF